MSPHDWFVEHRVDYVTRTLEESDLRTFDEHLARCPECTAEVRSIERDLAWLGMGVEPVPLRPGLRRRVIEAVLEPRGRRWLRRALPVALAASLAIGITGWLAGRSEVERLKSAVEQRDHLLAALMDTLSIMRGADRVLQASIKMDGREGGILIFDDSVTHRWNVVVHGLPPAPPGQVYRFWFICEEKMVPGAEVAAGTRPVLFTLGMPPGGGKVMGAALTVESVATPPMEPRGPKLAELML
jgi:hypothetical protein